jgi:DNA-binding transcriptional MerR regulator
MNPTATNDRSAGLRIGELSRRVGVSPETLRAWERRYSLTSPRRTEGGYRVYSSDDEARVRAMSRMREEGMAAADAARLAREDPQLRGQTGRGAVSAGIPVPTQAGAVLAGRASPIGVGVGAVAPAPSPRPALGRQRDALLDALRGFDEEAAQAVLDDGLVEFERDAVLERIVLESLAQLGRDWCDGLITVAQEHFASNLVRGWLLGLARGWGTGSGPLAVLACPPGERHDLGLIVFGVALRDQGWRVAFLGVDTPLGTLGNAAAQLSPETIVLACVEARRLRSVEPQLKELCANHQVLLAGAGANRRLASRVGARALEGEPTYAARRMAARV